MINSEKRNQKIAAIIAALFLVICFTCASQVAPMKFSCEKFDTLYVGIETDMIGDSRLIFSCSKHIHSDIVSITIGFVDGDILQVFAIDDWLILNTKKLEETQFDLISFDYQETSKACINIATKDYFKTHFFTVNK